MIRFFFASAGLRTLAVSVLATIVMTHTAWGTGGQWSSYPDGVELAGQAAAYDPVRQLMITFGGNGSSGETNDLRALALSGSPSWSTLPKNENYPSARRYASLVYDPIRDRLLLFGGRYGLYTRYNDLWEYDLADSQWSELSPGGTAPLADYTTNAVYDSLRDRLIVVGGDALVWALPLSGAPFNWSFIAQGGTPPPLMMGFRLVYDETNDRLITFGGHDELDCPPQWDDCSCQIPYCPDHCYPYCNLRTVAEYRLSGQNANIWYILSPEGTLPDWRAYHSAIYDPGRQRMVVFGGRIYGHDIFYDDVWQLTLSGTPTWTELYPTGGPVDARGAHAGIYDPVRDQLVIGGGATTTLLSDAWGLRFDSVPPAAIDDLLVEAAGRYSAAVSWTAPGDDGNSGQAEEFDLRYSTSAISTDAQFESASQVGWEPPPGSDGTYHCIELDNLTSCTTYYFAIKTTDESGNWSGLSNGASGTTTCSGNSAATCGSGLRAEREAKSGGTGWDSGIQAGPDAAALPEFDLGPAQPSPSAGSVRIRFTMGQRGPVSLRVYDLSGRLVRTLASGRVEAGPHEVVWDARDDGGRAVPAGVYFYKMAAGSWQSQRKVVFLER